VKLLLLTLNYAPEPTGIGLYSAGLAESLVKLGHQVSVVCANPHYPQWKRYPGYPALRWTRAEENGVSITRCPIYVPSRPSGLARIVHYAGFLLAALGPMLRRAGRERPDVVMTVAPALIAAPAALLAARVARATSWIHVQDFEVGAALATDQLGGGGSWLGRLARAFEAWMFRRFDRASSISPEMCGQLAGLVRDPSGIYELRNWAELDRVHPQRHSSYREEWGIATPHVALYSGSIARKQGIETIVDAARLLEGRSDLTFVVCGNGPTRAELEERARGLGNIRFYDLQPIERLGDLLSLATVHLLPQRADAADLVLPSKLANMLASGRPVVAGVEPGRGLAREVEGAGLICTPEDPAAMAQAIERLLADEALHAACSRVAEQRATARWSRDSIIERFACELAVAPQHAAFQKPRRRSTERS
jgi:colanic acid biosynthesis glycosyl transferase WcaI